MSDACLLTSSLDLKKAWFFKETLEKPLLWSNLFPLKALKAIYLRSTQLRIFVFYIKKQPHFFWFFILSPLCLWSVEMYIKMRKPKYAVLSHPVEEIRWSHFSQEHVIWSLQGKRRSHLAVRWQRWSITPWHMTCLRNTLPDDSVNSVLWNMT